MTFPVTEYYNAAAIGIKGDFFGSVHGPAFRDVLATLRSEGKTNIVLDLKHATLMDSSGIGVLLESVETLRAEGGDLRIAGLENKMRNLFLMTRLLGEVFDLYETTEEAVESFALLAVAV